ncbi:hypothetical protein TNCV_3360071 [Trichonephila clavipes]|nr:hypothetical protein TNCV_3360071 [Trichonephila clavipes]
MIHNEALVSDSKSTPLKYPQISSAVGSLVVRASDSRPEGLELLDSHKQELTIDELIEMHEQMQDIEELNPLSTAL